MQSTPETVKQSKLNVLIISHKEQQCGVYQYGINLAQALKESEKYTFNYAECSSADIYYEASVGGGIPCAQEVRGLPGAQMRARSMTLVEVGPVLMEPSAC